MFTVNKNVYYDADKSLIEAYKNDFLDTDLSVAELLNNKYKQLSDSDKLNLIYWSASVDEYALNKYGKVVFK